MDEVLYLDTARLGKISNGAQRALNDVLRFSQTYGASTYFDDMLFGGYREIQNPDDFHGLKSWQGIENLRTEFKQFVFGQKKGDAVFASRTGSLMAIASKMIFSRCRNVLVTDLNWRPYVEILSAAIPNDACRITCVPIKHQVFGNRASASDLVAHLKTAYIENQCDGLFLPAVCNRGVKLPVSTLLTEICQHVKIRFSIVDAAQAINHVELDWVKDHVDFTFGGTHKWLRSYQPMAIGYFAKPGSHSFIQNAIERELERNPMADPLMRMTQVNAVQKSETVNLCPLFAAVGALTDAKTQKTSVDSSYVRSVVQSLATRAGWYSLNINPEFQSRILLLKKARLHDSNAGVIRKMLSRLGVAVTDYPGGICRISLPRTINEGQADQLEHALANVV